MMIQQTIAMLSRVNKEHGEIIRVKAKIFKKKRTSHLSAVASSLPN
jgi:hypothetical protein